MKKSNKNGVNLSLAYVYIIPFNCEENMNFPDIFFQNV